MRQCIRNAGWDEQKSLVCSFRFQVFVFSRQTQQPVNKCLPIPLGSTNRPPLFKEAALRTPQNLGQIEKNNGAKRPPH
eukprot:1586329-Amphidinium_carterae.1